MLSGWGRVAPSRASVIHPRSVAEVVHALSSPAARSAGVIARGAGRSYGDAAQNGGGQVLDMTGWDRICSVDRERRLLTAQAGATVAQLLAALAPHGLTLPVLPGTRHVTLGGAIASDVHGKNHHRDGGLARHVVAMSLCTPAQDCVEITAESDAGLFFATLGGMGLTGVLVRATLSVQELPSPWLAVDSDRTEGLEQTLELMSGPESRRYSVAWMDLLAGGVKLGRAIVTRADHLADDGARQAGRGPRRAGSAYPGALERRPLLQVPPGFPGALLRRRSVGAFNTLRWHAAPRSERARPRAIAPYFFPLDRLGEWHRLYGAHGLLQYQFVIPTGEEAALVRCVELMRARRLPVYLAVFKRLGDQFGGPLSFPLAGWTLAVDLPAAAPGARATLPGRAPTGGSRWRARLRPVAASGVGRGWQVSSRGSGADGRRVVVAGGTSEIALAIVRALQERGPRDVALMGRDPGALERAAEQLRAQGCARALVVLSSVAAQRPRRANAVYGASKAGLDALAQGLGDALADAGVRVLVVRPGFVRTRMTQGLRPAPLATSADAVAAVVVKGLARGSHTVWAPRTLRWVMVAVRLLPRALMRRIRQ